jgi:hypothetical protein
VEEVTRDLLGLRPRRFLFVGDRGMVSQADLDFLESRRLGYLLGCPIRTDPALEPVRHRTPGRITAHVPICVLAYLLIRVVENRAQLGWDQTTAS